MATRLEAKRLPHLKNVEAGRSKWDPVYTSIYEVAFQAPTGLTNPNFETVSSDDFKLETYNPGDLALLTEQVKKVTGLDNLHKTPGVSSQKFYGVDVSYLQSNPENTYIEFSIEFNLNMRNNIDVYVFEVFRNWLKCNYDIESGVRMLKSDYTADFFTINEAARNGMIWRRTTIKDVILTGVTGLDELNYGNKDAANLTCSFRGDYWNQMTKNLIV